MFCKNIIEVGDVSWCVSMFSHNSTNTTFFSMTPTTFLKCFNNGERRKYAGKEAHLNRVWYSQPPGHEFDMLTTDGGPEFWNIMRCHYTEKMSSVSSSISTFSALILFPDIRLSFLMLWKYMSI